MYIKILDKMISPLAYIIKDTDKTTEKIRSSLCVAYDQYLSSLKKIQILEKFLFKLVIDKLSLMLMMFYILKQ